MQDLLVELSVGESIQIGQYTVTLLEVDGEELVVELDSDGSTESELELESLRESLELV